MEGGEGGGERWAGMRVAGGLNHERKEGELVVVRGCVGKRERAFPFSPSRDACYRGPSLVSDTVETHG